jgi:acyl transferase domain-containing protein
MQALPVGGGMLAVEAELAHSADWQERYGLSLAAVNGPQAIVLSGAESGIAALAEELKRTGRRSQRLTVSHAFHSELMQPMLAEFERVVSELQLTAAKTPIASNVTGELCAPERFAEPRYWVEHVRRAVLFYPGLQALTAHGATRFLELGPQGVLTALVHSAQPRAAAWSWSLLRRDRPEPESLLTALAGLHASGHAVDFRRMLQGRGRSIELPTYPFQRERFWLNPSLDVATVQPVSDELLWAAAASSNVEQLRSALGADVTQTEALKQVLPLLQAWRERERAQTALSALRYRVTWEPCKVTPRDLRGRWLVVQGESLESTTLAQRFCQALQEQGAEVGLLSWGPEAPASELLVWAERGVISCLDAAGPSAAADSVMTALDLLRALLSAGARAPLWLITQAAVAVSEREAPQPERAALWGIARVAQLELPRAFGGVLDLDAEPDMAALTLALHELSRASEQQLALRAGHVLACRLTRAERPRTTRAFQARGTALVTGGTGALGAHVARKLAQAGADHVVLTSRSGERAPGALQLKAALEADGVRVTLVALDVADRAALAGLLEDLDAQGQAPTIVVHTAGVVGRAALTTLTRAELAHVLRAKVDGARNLDALLGERELDAFVLFASGAGVWGSAEQGAYAAANVYLDALAQQRRARGLAATSVAWGIWGGGGMAEASAAQLARIGVKPLAPELAIEALWQALTGRALRRRTRVGANGHFCRQCPRRESRWPGLPARKSLRSFSSCRRRTRRSGSRVSWLRCARRLPKC